MNNSLFLSSLKSRNKNIPVDEDKNKWVLYRKSSEGKWYPRELIAYEYYGVPIENDRYESYKLLENNTDVTVSGPSSFVKNLVREDIPITFGQKVIVKGKNVISSNGSEPDPKADITGFIVGKNKDTSIMVAFDGIDYGLRFDQLATNAQKYISTSGINVYGYTYNGFLLKDLVFTDIDENMKKEEEIKPSSNQPFKYGDIVSCASNKVNGKVIGYYDNGDVLMASETINNHNYSFSTLSDAAQIIIKNANLKNPYLYFFNRVNVNNLTLIKSHNQNKNTKKETTKMSNSLVETLKDDAKEAAYRVAGTQITNGVKLGLIKLFESKGGKSDQMEMLKGLLDSEVGDSLISLILGYGLNYAPGLKDDQRVQKLSEEFRVNGMSVAGNMVFGVAMESIVPVITKALNSLPAEETTNVRVPHNEENEEENVAPPTRLSKRAGK